MLNLPNTQRIVIVLSSTQLKMELGKGEAEVCRLCGQCESIYIDIFGEMGTKRLLNLKINNKMNILIDKKDPLPKTICVQCLGKLEFVCDFQEECLRTQEALREHYNLPLETAYDTPSTSPNSNDNDNKGRNSPKGRRVEESELVPKTSRKIKKTTSNHQPTEEGEEPATHFGSVIQHTSAAEPTEQPNPETITPIWLRSKPNTEANPDVTSDSTLSNNRIRHHDTTEIEINENGEKHVIQIPTTALNKLLSIVSKSPNILKETRHQGVNNDVSFTVELCEKEHRAQVVSDQSPSSPLEPNFIDFLQNQNSASSHGTAKRHRYRRRFIFHRKHVEAAAIVTVEETASKEKRREQKNLFINLMNETLGDECIGTGRRIVEDEEIIGRTR